MSTILNVAIPAAGTIISPAYQIAEEEDFNSLACQANFVYGNGGTSADFFIQTTLDGGATWLDTMHFHCLLANYRKLLNVSRLPEHQGLRSDQTNSQLVRSMLTRQEHRQSV